MSTVEETVSAQEVKDASRNELCAKETCTTNDKAPEQLAVDDASNALNSDAKKPKNMPSLSNNDLCVPSIAKSEMPADDNIKEPSNEPVQVQKVDSSEKATCKQSTSVNDSASCQFLIRLSTGPQFIVPGNLQPIENSGDKPNAFFPNSMPPSLIQILPTVLSEASSAVLDQKAKSSTKNAPNNVSNLLPNSSLSIEIPPTSMTTQPNPSMSKMLVELQPLSPSIVTSSNAQVVGPTNVSCNAATIPTFLITFSETKDDTIKKEDAQVELKDNDDDEDEALRYTPPLELDDDSKDALNLDELSQSPKPSKEKNTKIKRKRRGRRKGSDVGSLDADKPLSDRLICDLCPEASDDPSKSQELNCNQVGPNYGIRITQNVSRCFVCTVELKTLREVWAHADTPDHKQKVHNLLVNQSARKKGLTPRKGTSALQKNPETDEQVDAEIKLEPIDDVTKIDFEGMEMPKLMEQTVRLTRKRSIGTPSPSYKAPKRKRNLSGSSSESLPVLEKITLNINTCPICETEFDDVVQKLDHAMSEHDSYKEILQVLSSAVHSAREGEQLRACMICKKVYSGIENLLSHLIAVHQIKARMLENIDIAREIIQNAIQKKSKTESPAKVEEVVERRPIVAIEDVTDMSEFSATKCLYCNRTYTTASRLESHYKSTGHRKLLMAKKGRQKKECHHCHKIFKSAVACKVHLRRTIPDPAGGPCKSKLKEKEVEDAESKKAIIRVPGGGIKDAVPVNSNLTCQNCNEAFSTIHTFQLHSRTTSPTKKGCVPLTPSFKAGGAKPLYASLDDDTVPVLKNETTLEQTEEVPTEKLDDSTDGTEILGSIDPVPGTAAAATCSKCTKAFNSPYALKMHLALTSYSEKAKMCVRKCYRKRAVGVVRYGMKKRKPAKKKSPKKFWTGDSLKLEVDDDSKEDSINQTIINDFKELGESFFPRVKSNSLSIDNFNAKPELIETANADDAHITESLDNNVAEVRHRASRGSMYTEKDCHCRICFKALSTPWNRNAHERNIHNYDVNFPNSTSMTSSLPTMVPLPSTALNSHLDDSHKYQCMTCHAYFNEASGLKDHYIETSHGTGVAGANDEKKCKYCKKTFSSTVTRNLHNRKTVPVVKSGKCIPIAVLANQLANSKSETTCQVCHKELTTVVSKVKHENVVHRSYFMKKYGRLPASKARQSNKTETSAGVGLVSTMKYCKLCKKEFYSASQLQMHYATADHKKSVASESKSLENNQTKPTIIKPTIVSDKPAPVVQSKADKTCKFCLKVFAKVWNRKYHEENVHRNGRGRHVSKSSLEVVRTDEFMVQPSSSMTPIPEFPFLKSTPSMTVIPLNDKNESSSPQLNAVGKQVWVCIRCKRPYTTAERLEKHYALTGHKEEVTKSFPALPTCNFCKKSFKSVRALRIHESITVPRPDKGRCVYKVGIDILESQTPQTDTTSKICRFCQRTFSTSWHRRVHESQSHVFKKDAKAKSRANRMRNAQKPEKMPPTPPSQDIDLKKSKWFYSNEDGKLVPMDSNMIRRLCRVCNKVFTTIWYMRAHVRRSHPHVFDQHYSQKFPDDESNDPVICVIATPRQYGKVPPSPSKSSPNMKSILNTPPVNSSSYAVTTNSPSLNGSGTNRTVTIHHCKICCREFKWRTALEEHLLTCSTDSLAFKCRICGVMFKERRQLGPHWRKHQRNEDSDLPSLEMFVAIDRFGVPIDQQTATQSRTNISHTARMQGRDLTAPRPAVAGANGAGNSTVNDQDGAKAGGKHLECYRCAGCNKIFMNAVKFIQHRLTHFSESSVTEISDRKPFCCEVCNMVLEHHTLVQVHLLEHLRVERRKSCYVHNQVLKPGMLINPSSPTSDDALEVPSLDQKQEPSQQNVVPNKTSPSIIPSQHNRIRRYSCSFCRKRFPTMAKYMQHSKMDNCTARAKVKNQVWEQMRLAQETGQFRSGEDMSCDDGESNGDSFKDEDGDDFEAEEAYFETKSALSCRFCDKTFEDLPSRETHELVHCEATTFCKICHMQFNASLEGITHADFQHPFDIFRCTPCATTFPNYELMKDHVMSLPETHAGSFQVTASNKSSNGIEDNDNPLREDFTKLLGVLLGDDILLHELGWKKRPIDLVLEDVMQRTGIEPVAKSTHKNALELLRENIKLMLSTSLEDSVQETVGLGKEAIDKVVREMLILSQDD